MKMTGQTRMSLAVAGRKRQTVQTARHLAECSRKWRLRNGAAWIRFPISWSCLVFLFNSV